MKWLPTLYNVRQYIGVDGLVWDGGVEDDDLLDDLLTADDLITANEWKVSSH